MIHFHKGEEDIAEYMTRGIKVLIDTHKLTHKEKPSRDEVLAFFAGFGAGLIMSGYKRWKIMEATTMSVMEIDMLYDLNLKNNPEQKNA